MTDFNLHWKASQEACSTSWGIKAHSHSSSNFKLSTESWGVLQTLLSWINHTEKSRVQIRAPWGPFIFADECWPESSCESFWSHVMEWSLVEDSKVHHQSSYVPRETVQLPKCSKCTAGCSVSRLRVYKREEISQWLWLPPTPSQKVDSGVCLLSCLPLIHL